MIFINQFYIIHIVPTVTVYVITILLVVFSPWAS